MSLKEKRPPRNSNKNVNQITNNLMNVKDPKARFRFESEKNVFSKFYTRRKPTKASKENMSDVGKELQKYTHDDAIEFAATSWTWVNSPAGQKLKRGPITFKVPTFSCQKGVRAYYRVVSENEDGTYVLIACHVNVHGLHRGDLLFVTVDDQTVLREYENTSVCKKLFLGDVVAVTELVKISPGPLTIPNIYHLNHDSQYIWAVRRMTLLTRRMEYDLRFTCLSNGTAIAVGYSEAMDVWSWLRNKPKIETVCKGDVFIPALIVYQFTEDLLAEFENKVLEICSELCCYPTATSTIFTFAESEQMSRMLSIGQSSMSHSEISEPESIVELCALFGSAAVSASDHGRMDPRGFPILNARIEGRLVRFSIINPPERPTEGRWNCNTRVTIHFTQVSIDGVIETVLKDTENRLLDIAVRMPKDVVHDIKLKKGSNIVFQRGQSDSTLLQEEFFTKLSFNTNGYKIIKTLYGGPAIALSSIFDIDVFEFFFPGQMPIELDDDQNQYVSMILAGNALVIGSAAFGCGKSMTMMTAAIEVFRRSKLDEVQLLLTQSNYASVNLVEIAKKVKGIDWKVVRCVSLKNWNELPDECRTDYDLPVLMGKMFVAWAVGEAKYSVINKKSVVRFVVQRNLVDKSQLTKEARQIADDLTEQQRKEPPIFQPLAKEFFNLYRADVVISTTNSLPLLIESDRRVLPCTSLIQIDEAGQVPECILLDILSKFPNTRYGLVGDTKQLPPFCDGELTGKLKEFGVGNTLERAIDKSMFPVAVFRNVYRCHPTTTRVLSELFYDGQLKCLVGENQRNEFMSSRLDFWPDTRSSFVILNNMARSDTIGTSKMNKAEKNIVVELVKLLTKKHGKYQLKASNVGVISFYAAQTNILTEALRGTGVKCGTVDAFQGTEREVIVLCCTNDRLSEFVQLPNRLNVALSRARQATIIVGKVEMLKHAKYWNTIVQLTERNGCVINSVGDVVDGTYSNFFQPVYSSDEEFYKDRRSLNRVSNPKRTRKARREKRENRQEIEENQN